MNTLSFKINNKRTLKLIQRNHDESVLINIEDDHGNTETISDNEAIISAANVVMLINYYRNCKTGLEVSDYIKGV